MQSNAVKSEVSGQDRMFLAYSSARRTMVDNQIRTFDVTDTAVLAAFETVPREIFVPEADRPLAYLDRRIDIYGNRGSRALLPPLILARLIQALSPRAGERALDVLGGFGYSAALLAAIGMDVTALEADEAFVEAGRMAVKNLPPSLAEKITFSAPAIQLCAQDIGLSLSAAPYDVILINGASEREPSAFFPLLKEGGRLGIILREGKAARAHVYTQSAGHVSPRPIFDAQAPILAGFAKVEGFTF